MTCVISLGCQVRRERDSDPIKTELMMRRGQLLVRFAREGRLRDMDQVSRSCPRGEMLAWFTVRMFKEACAHNHLQTMRFMVDHGLDVEFHAVLEAVHWLVDGCDEEQDGIDVVPAIDFLVTEAGMPPDVQRKSDFRTPLHVAVRRGLFEAARRLIELGADVNAVAKMAPLGNAKGDVMPLTLAEEPAETDGFRATDDTSPEAGDDVATKGKAAEIAAGAAAVNRYHLTRNDGARDEQGVREEDHDVERMSLAAERGRQCGEETSHVGGVGARSPSPSSRSLCRRRWSRVMASRARICEILVERGARRGWRRAPSEEQVALDKKYAVLLEGDDGRNFCTFSG
ncbi:conserved unknown protein [Ectocarpus siliculosus]|uniref:Uncharacterized protein n=1 Tax=Ectocarpus siliculosus TaxID=2880 RepID=D8LKT8_ECTSI|nr:conserved unknown protein [Ectocarpus siliculosus]|eukprot:CBN80071.1 conserved unknown protein [Ectocarpus siliculosus]